MTFIRLFELQKYAGPISHIHRDPLLGVFSKNALSLCLAQTAKLNASKNRVPKGLFDIHHELTFAQSIKLNLTDKDSAGKVLGSVDAKLGHRGFKTRQQYSKVSLRCLTKDYKGSFLGCRDEVRVVI